MELACSGLLVSDQSLEFLRNLRTFKLRSYLNELISFSNVKFSGILDLKLFNVTLFEIIKGMQIK